MKHLASLLFVLAACKGKKTEPAAAPPTPGSASAAVVEIDAAAPAPKAVTVPAGVANFGCLGWSKSAKAAACITGESALGEPAKFALTYLGGSEPPTPITVKQGGGEDMFDDVTAANASLAKLGVEPFAGDAKDIEPGKTTDLGGGASIDWKTKETKKGGDNFGPTIRH